MYGWLEVRFYSCSSNLDQLDAADSRELSQGAHVVPHTQRQMVGRTCLAPASQKVTNRTTEADSGVGVTRLRDLPRNGLTLRRDHAEFSVSIHVDAEERDGTRPQRELHTDAASRFSVIFFQLAQSGLSLRNGNVVRAVVTDEDHVVANVKGMDLRKGAATNAVQIAEKLIEKGFLPG